MVGLNKNMQDVLEVSKENAKRMWIVSLQLGVQNGALEVEQKTAIPMSRF